MGPNVYDESRRVLEPLIEVGRSDRREGRRAGRGLDWRGNDGLLWQTSSEDGGRMAEPVGNGLSEVADIGLVVGGGNGDGVGCGVTGSAEKVHVKHRANWGINCNINL